MFKHGKSSYFLWLLDFYVDVIEDAIEELWEEEEEEVEGDREEEEIDEVENNDTESTVSSNNDDVFDDEDDEPLGTSGKKALINVRNELKRAKNDLKKYQGIDLEEYERIQAEKAKSEEQRLRDQAEWERLSKKHEQTIKRNEREKQTLQEQNRQLIKQSELKDFFYLAKGKHGRSSFDGKTHFDQVAEAINNRTRREANGEYTVLNVDGFEAKNEDGKPMSMAELMEEMRNDPYYGHFFEPRITTGSGQKPGNNNGNGNISREDRWAEIKRRNGIIDNPGVRFNR